MREIKFRGKREDNGEWVYGCYLETQMSGVYIIGSTLEAKGKKESIKMHDKLWQHEVVTETVGQYTGLKDKNGKEIYEGDIVSFEDSDGGYEYPDLVVNTGIVEYGELGFYFTNRVAVEMDDFYIKDGRCDDIEVVGNIYEQED